MYVPFDQLPDTSRVWIYTSNRPLNSEEQKNVTDKLEEFSHSWQSHQNDVVASFTLLKDRFVVIATDNTSQDVSGCGIDKSVHLLSHLENELKISLLDKSTTYFEKEDEIFSVPLSKIKAAVISQQIETSTFFYNTLISSKKELKTHFFCSVLEGWTQRYFSAVNSKNVSI